MSPPPDPLPIAARWLAVAAASTVLATGFGDRALDALLPWIRDGLQWLNPWAEIRRLEQAQVDGQWRVVIRLEAVRLLLIGLRPIPPHWGVDVAVASGAVWQTPVVAVATAAAWPASARRQVGAALLAGAIATAVAAVLVGVSATGIALAGIHDALAGDQPVPPIVRMPRFLEAGGRLMAGFVAGLVAVAVVAAVAQVAAARRVRRHAGRGSPGSMR